MAFKLPDPIVQKGRESVDPCGYTCVGKSCGVECGSWDVCVGWGKMCIYWVYYDVSNKSVVPSVECPNIHTVNKCGPVTSTPPNTNAALTCP